MRHPNHTPYYKPLPKRRRKRRKSYTLWYVTGMFVCLIIIFSIYYAYNTDETQGGSKNKEYPVSEIVNPDQAAMPTAPASQPPENKSPDRANQANETEQVRDLNQKQSEAPSSEPSGTNHSPENSKPSRSTEPAPDPKPSSQPKDSQPNDSQAKDQKPDNQQPANNKQKKDKDNSSFWDSLSNLFR